MDSDRIVKSIYIVGSAVLAALFALWAANADYSVAGYAAAFGSAALFYGVCLQFVPAWVKSWQDGEKISDAPENEREICAKIFLSLIAWDVLIILLAYLLRFALGFKESFSQYLNFWTCTDSRHYLDIARDWYLSEGDKDRLVQLVFLPGYPIAVRLMNVLVRNYLVSGLAVSALCFGGAGCVFYKLMRLDMSRESSLRALKFLCISPAVFFFAAPMSESLFLLLCLACVYMTRRDRLLPACIFGALAAFTRSLGIILIVPVLFELIATRSKAKNYFCLLIIPIGFAAYCFVNYQVSGEAFKFVEYESDHWNQHIGLFFNTAAYQTDYLIKELGENVHSALGLWLANLGAAFFSLGIMLMSVRRLRPSYTAFFIAYFVVAIGATWLLSAPRYLAAMFVLYAALSCLTENRKTDIIISSISGALFIAYFFAFVQRWQVW